MRNTSQNGFNVFGLAAIVAVLLLLLVVLFPACHNASHCCDLTYVGIRGREIYVEITGANTEREALKLPPVWPSDCIQRTETNGTNLFRYCFDNSTDYFRYLFESKVCAGFDYSKLAFGNVGVPAWRKGPLTAENNMWTVAKNMRDEMDDILPFLITRNVDATSLRTKVSAHDGEKRLSFDSEWKTPFGEKAFVLIRKGGATFRAREKYLTCHYVYQGQVFDTAVDAQLRQTAPPLTYLAPTYEVVNGEKKYSEKVYRDLLAQHEHEDGSNAGTSYSIDALRERVIQLEPARKAKRDISLALRLYTLSFAAVGFIYVAFGLLYRFGRKRMDEPCSASGPVIKSVVVHGVAVSVFFAFLAYYLSSIYVFYSSELGMGAYLAAALVVQIVGTVFVARLLRENPAAQRCGIKWMVSVPLVACTLFIALWAVLNVLFDRLSHLF